MFRDAYRGLRVFITGHTGFKGSWLSLWLDRLGASITGFSLPIDSRPNHFELLGLDRPTSLEGDIRDRSALEAAMARCAPEMVFHLAAQPLVRRSYAEPALTLETNVMGTANLLEAVRATPSVKAVIVVTSDKCYENKEQQQAYKESDPLGGHDPYSASKGCAEIVASSYARSFFEPAGGPRLATVRAGNVIGGGDWAEDRLIPDLARAAASGRTATIRNPRACRPWQHVLDPLCGYLGLGRKLLQGRLLSRAYNFGPDERDSLCVGEVAEMFAKQWDRVRFDFSGDRRGPHEACSLKLDSSLARRDLGWRPLLDASEAIAAAAEWYRRQREGEIISLLQLDDYTEKARAARMDWAGEPA